MHQGYHLILRMLNTGVIETVRADLAAGIGIKLFNNFKNHCTEIDESAYGLQYKILIPSLLKKKSISIANIALRRNEENS